MRASWGKQRRLARLRSSSNAYLWLALDHGLTFGPVQGIENLSDVLRLAEKSPLSGVVLNKGSLSSLEPTSHLGLVLQTFGLPAMPSGSPIKVPITRLEEAIRLHADAIAVELNLNVLNLADAVQAASSMISQAAAHDMPNLLMIAPHEGQEPHWAMANAIRVSSELGADLIKVGLPNEALDYDEHRLDIIRKAITNAPPVLLAGGGVNSQLPEKLALSRDLGFSGICIGRNIFQSSDPSAIITKIATAFKEGAGNG